MVVFLTGFPGSGKSTVGALLAKRLGFRFIDYDDEIPASWREYNKQGEFVPDEEVKEFFPVFLANVADCSRTDDLVVAVVVGFDEHAQKLQSFSKNSILLCLKAEKQLLISRVQERMQGHFFGPKLLERAFGSKYDISYTCIEINAAQPVDMVVEECFQHIAKK